MDTDQAILSLNANIRIKYIYFSKCTGGGFGYFLSSFKMKLFISTHVYIVDRELNCSAQNFQVLLNLWAYIKT